MHRHLRARRVASTEADLFAAVTAGYCDDRTAARRRAEPVMECSFCHRQPRRISGQVDRRARTRRTADGLWPRPGFIASALSARMGAGHRPAGGRRAGRRSAVKGWTICVCRGGVGEGQTGPSTPTRVSFPPPSWTRRWRPAAKPLPRSAVAGPAGPPAPRRAAERGGRRPIGRLSGCEPGLRTCLCGRCASELALNPYRFNRHAGGPPRLGRDPWDGPGDENGSSRRAPRSSDNYTP